MNSETSIIIRTCNEEKMIEKTLKAICNQHYKKFEIIIIDSESTDNTLKIASQFPVKIRKIRKKDFTYGKALNIGCKIAKGKFLVFLSAHAIPFNEKWLENLIKNFKNPKMAGIYGKQIPHKNCNPLIKKQILEHWNKKKGKIQYKDPTFCNPNSAILKKIWKEIPFNEKLIASEDYDWAKKIQKKGYLISYEPEAIVYHSHNESPKQILHRFYRESYAILLINNKKFKLNYFMHAPYTLYKDFIYIIKNKYNPTWLLKSIITN